MNVRQGIASWILVLVCGLFHSSLIWAQNIGINIDGSTPDASAILDVKSENRGFLLPRVALEDITDIVTIYQPAHGLLVFNTNSDMAGGNGVGFYFYCKIDCEEPGWKYLLFAENGPGGDGDQLVSRGAGKSPIWLNQDSLIMPNDTCVRGLFEACEGGVVFWMDEAGEHGFVVSMVDVSPSSPWSNVTSGTIGTTSTANWTGLANTNDIISQTGHTASAAQLCADYVNDDYGTGVYNDWFLPSRGTLVIINGIVAQLNAPIIANGGNPISATGDASDRYWSSSEATGTNAWCRRFGNTTNYNNNKGTTFRVRCVRTF